MKIVFLGLSITSSWGNGHATTYRGLVRELAERGHEILFLERDVPWYADNRDAPALPDAEIALYRSLPELARDHRRAVQGADAVIIGSFVPDGVQVAEWVWSVRERVVAFYDIDTPVTLRAVEAGACPYLNRNLIPRFDLYLSFTGGPTLRRLEREFGAQRARALYCSVDPDAYFPEAEPAAWEVGYLGTYSPDRQPTLSELLLSPAARFPQRRFVVAGAQYPKSLAWPANVDRIEHLPPHAHRRFYNRQRFALNVTRADMIAAGHSPSVRLFEAAACGTPIITDAWPGLADFFLPGAEIIVAATADEVADWLQPAQQDRAQRIGRAAREQVLARHTAAHRAQELEQHLSEAAGGARPLVRREKERVA